jgi:hypothetical protein
LQCRFESTTLIETIKKLFKTMKKTFLTALALGAMIAQSQVIYTPNGTTTSATINNTGSTAGFVGIGTDAPTACLEIQNQPGTTLANLKFKSVPPVGVQAGNSKIEFHSGGFISQSTFPSMGSGTLSFGIGGTSVFNIYNNALNVGTVPNYCSYRGIANVGGLLWATKTTIGNFISSCPGTYTYPSDGVMDVLGKAYFRDKIVLGIAKTNTVNNYPAGYRLYVEDGILTERLKVAVKTSADWADYVFAKDYALKSLDSVETYIQTNKHLPDVPSAAEVVNEGIDVAKMDAKLLQKIEELTLYVIDINKKVDAKEKENQIEVASLKKKIEALEVENKGLKK